MLYLYTHGAAAAAEIVCGGAVFSVADTTTAVMFNLIKSRKAVKRACERCPTVDRVVDDVCS